jgi:hypothetical protein
MADDDVLMIDAVDPIDTSVPDAAKSSTDDVDPVCNSSEGGEETSGEDEWTSASENPDTRNAGVL